MCTGFCSARRPVQLHAVQISLRPGKIQSLTHECMSLNHFKWKICKATAGKGLEIIRCLLSGEKAKTRLNLMFNSETVK